MTGRRLVMFDVDGTIADSQGDIVAAMTEAFAAAGLPAPLPAAVLGIVGLSLDVAVPRLAPEVAGATHAAMVADYKAAYRRRRLAGGVSSSPLYPGMRDAIARFAAQPDTVLGLATGKSLRGLTALLDGHGLAAHFTTLQAADHHRSKPHPSMLTAAMAETGVGPARTVMIGDTTFDRDMAQGAGTGFVAVGWGYHPVAALAGADAQVRHAAELPAAVDRVISARGGTT